MPSVDIVIPAYNAARVLPGTLEAIQRQHRPDGLNVGIIVVNNGSSDSTGAAIDAWIESGVRRVDYATLKSRAAARNAGARASSADFVFFLDADCRLSGDACLDTVADAIAAGAAGGFGFATGETDTFWGRYHAALAARRARAEWLGWTTQCCVVSRELFDRVGGFSEEYLHYGFEDRDFFCRLRAAESPKTLRSLPELAVVHDPHTSMPEICRKMYESGRYSSGIFRRDFPVEYRAMAYARVDAATASRGTVVLLQLIARLEKILIGLTESLTQWRNVPLTIGRPFVRLCSASSYFRGTVDRDSS